MQVNRLEDENQKLKLELAKVFDENSLLKQNEENCLQQVGKLSKLLEQMREKQQDRLNREKEAEMIWRLSQQKIGTVTSLKDVVGKQLDQAENEIKQREREENDKAA